MKTRRSFPRRFGVFLLVAFVLYSVVGFVAAPFLLKSQLEKRLPAELGREVRIESVRLNPWILSATIKGLAIADRDGGPFIGWEQFYVNFDPTTFFVKEWRFQEITAVAPSGRVIVNQDGTLNFTDLLEKFAPKEEAGEPAWPLRVAKMVVTGAQLDFTDQSRSTEFTTHVGPVNFTLVQFHTSPDRNAPYEFIAETESGEKLRWAGTVSVNPIASKGDLLVSGIRPGKYAPYYRDSVRFDVLDGLLDVSGRYEVALSDAGPTGMLENGRVHLTNFKIAPRDSTQPVLELHDLEMTGLAANLATQAVKAEKILVTGGNAAVHRNREGTIDLLALLSPVAPTAATPPPSTTEDTPRPQVEIGAFSVRHFRATFDDESTPRRATNTIENAEVDLQNVTLANGASMPVRVALTLPGRGAVSLDGSFSLFPMQATFAVDVANISLATISPYVEPMVNANITRGVVTTRGNARVALPADQPMELEYKGDLNVEQFGAVDGVAKEELIGWSQLFVKGIDFKGMPLDVAVEEVTWSDPRAHVLVNRDGTINLLAALQPATGLGNEKKDTPDARPSTPPDAAPMPAISIGMVGVTNGTFTFADRSVQPEVSIAIKAFGGTIAGLSSDKGARAGVDLKANVGGSGPISITGQLAPFGENRFVDLKVDFNDVELTPFSPYAGKFAGFELARGKLFLDVNAKLQNEAVDMSNVVTLTQFTFGAPTQSPEATKLPVRLAVALLKDASGKITLDVPVQGSLGDSSFRIGKVVGQVIQNLLMKVATSPFSLLGAMFGGGGEELAFQEFVPGDAELTDGNEKKLETLTKALNGRPALNLAISGSFDPVADARVIKERRLAQVVRSRLWDERRAVDPTVPPPELMEVTPDDELMIVRKLFAEKFPDSMPVNAIPPPPEPEPVAEPKEEQERKGFLRRAADIVTLKSWRDGRSEEEEEKQENAEVGAPAGEVVAPEVAAVATGPSLAEMKTRLAETVEVTTDDLRRLAARRGERIREHFMQQNIAGERLFLASVSEEGKGARAFLELQ